MFKILTDSTADLPKEYLLANDISCVNLSYIVDGVTYGRGEELPCHDFYDLMKEGPFGNWDADECYQLYKSLTNKHDKMVFHISANKVIMHRSA